ncbi:MAG: CYTH domain-containing protein [Enterococcus sp.]
MSQSIEIEYKTLLTKNEFSQICQFYHLTKQDFTRQSNTYFDTPDGQLKQHKMGLRIRQLATHAEITLKTPLPEGLLETSQTLSLASAQQLIEQQVIPADGPVATELKKHHIAIEQLKVIASLTTKRKEIVLTEGLLAIDESWYGASHDYELELEVPDATKGKLAFDDLLIKLNITYKKAANKIVRAIQEKKI